VAAVTIKSVRKVFGPVEVLHSVNVDIADGEFVILVGPSGCGKTTLLRMIAGLEDISDGEILIDGRRVNDIPPKARDVAMVFQNYALYPHMTVSQNMSFALRLAHANAAEITARVTKAAQILGLETLLERFPRQLSGGQRQRVAMGRALVRDPQVFLFDEPLSNLDAKLRMQMRAEIKELQQRLETTTVYVTHDQSEALTLADRLVVMHEGKIRQVGKPSEIYDTPADTFVASFIGSPGMNLWQRPSESGDGGELSFEGAVKLSRGLHIAISDFKRAVTVGVRPEHLHLVDASNDEGATICGRVEAVEHLGSHLLVHASLSSEGGGPVLARLDAGVILERGQQILLGAERDHVHLFDTETGMRLGGIGRGGGGVSSVGARHRGA